MSGSCVIGRMRKVGGTDRCSVNGGRAVEIPTFLAGQISTLAPARAVRSWSPSSFLRVLTSLEGQSWNERNFIAFLSYSSFFFYKVIFHKRNFNKSANHCTIYSRISFSLSLDRSTDKIVHCFTTRKKEREKESLFVMDDDSIRSYRGDDNFEKKNLFLAS